MYDNNQEKIDRIVKWRLEQRRLGRKIGLAQGDVVELMRDDTGSYPKRNEPLIVDTFTEMGDEIWLDVIYPGMPLMVDPFFRDRDSCHLPIYTYWKLWKKRSKTKRKETK